MSFLLSEMEMTTMNPSPLLALFVNISSFGSFYSCCVFCLLCQVIPMSLLPSRSFILSVHFSPAPPLKCFEGQEWVALILPMAREHEADDGVIGLIRFLLMALSAICWEREKIMAALRRAIWQTAGIMPGRHCLLYE